MWYFAPYMSTVISAVNASPVNVEERKNLGLRSGDTVRVHQKIQEKGKVRIQVFEGLVIARKHGDEAGGTFTVRATLSGVGVEKIFPLFSPLIDKIEILRRSKVRRAKLYYIREKVAREIRRQLRNMQLMGLATESGREVAERAEKAAADLEAKAQAEAAAKAQMEKETAEREAAEQAAQQTVETSAPAEEVPAPEATEEKKEA